METNTRYGWITEDWQKFGYGSVHIDVCSAKPTIVYQDATGYREWKTVKGFERWADKMRDECGSAFGPIGEFHKGHNDVRVLRDRLDAVREDFEAGLITVKEFASVCEDVAYDYAGWWHR